MSDRQFLDQTMLGSLFTFSTIYHFFLKIRFGTINRLCQQKNFIYLFVVTYLTVQGPPQQSYKTKLAITGRDIIIFISFKMFFTRVYIKSLGSFVNEVLLNETCFYLGNKLGMNLLSTNYLFGKVGCNINDTFKISFKYLYKLPPRN